MVSSHVTTMTSVPTLSEPLSPQGACLYLHVPGNEDFQAAQYTTFGTGCYGLLMALVHESELGCTTVTSCAAVGAGPFPGDSRADWPQLWCDRSRRGVGGDRTWPPGKESTVARSVGMPTILLGFSPVSPFPALGHLVTMQ